ncbi:TraR/DksA family transcriptional regulator [Aneurinibacillus soli]|uniref:General stress protein 16O n=1 Tax=Aneurinibacillus soli TaxID=1500254 RepID=A0A0U4NEQ3_9BACL|nr:TraR/DksA C4-type zinc finger protein [Aneurinibacillus soli]PYE63687.1 TraR/DksA family transcriptional regulator [Aneurinibacillus soli]BAU27380.1 General stress protein 16O [Aneurinibacillus soli]
MLSSQDLAYFRGRLTRQLNDLKTRLADNDHYGTGRAAMQESIGELSNYDNHPADIGSEMFEREKDIALTERTEQDLYDTEQALTAIQNGTYGTCEVCGADISRERLEAVPQALRCVQHAEQEVGNRRPVEEEVLGNSFGTFDYDHKDVTMYDAEDALQDVTRYGTSDSPADHPSRDGLSYDDMYLEAEEPIGYVEDVESLALSDMEGNYIGINTDSPLHKEYERRLDGADDTDWMTTLAQERHVKQD